MKHFVYRPWGNTHWLLSKSQLECWVVLGCLSTEVRSVKSAAYLSKYAHHVTLVSIADPGSHADEEYEAALVQNRANFSENCGCNHDIVEKHLKESLDEIAHTLEQVVKRSSNVILDITSFPKRWFFPLVRLLIQDSRVENLLITYARGTNYAQVLSENPETLRALPSFAISDDRQDHDIAFVGVGFHTQSLISMFGDQNSKSMHMLIPFPPGPPSTKKNWQFIQKVEQIIHSDNSDDGESDRVQYVSLEAIDVSHAFDLLRIKTNSGDKTSVLAPYGPKTFSLAMCLFAVSAEESGKSEVPVFYSQPQRYALDYTGDVAMRNGSVDSFAYSIKHKGKLLYVV